MPACRDCRWATARGTLCNRERSTGKRSHLSGRLIPFPARWVEYERYPDFGDRLRAWMTGDFTGWCGPRGKFFRGKSV